MTSILATSNTPASKTPRMLALPPRPKSTTRIRARALTIKKPLVTENLLDDIYYCAEWADQKYITVQDAQGEPMFLLTPERIQWALSKAAAALTASSALNRQCWSIEDLIAQDNFARVCDWDGNHDVIRVLIQIAKEWVCVPASTLAQMEMICSEVVCF